MADLKGTLQVFVQRMFPDTKIRLRPSYFPFTEPSARWMSVYMCRSAAECAKDTVGWRSSPGYGGPRVLAKVGYDPQEVSGFALAWC